MPSNLLLVCLAITISGAAALSLSRCGLRAAPWISRDGRQIQTQESMESCVSAFLKEINGVEVNRQYMQVPINALKSSSPFLMDEFTRPLSRWMTTNANDHNDANEYRNNVWLETISMTFAVFVQYDAPQCIPFLPTMNNINSTATVDNENALRGPYNPNPMPNSANSALLPCHNSNVLSIMLAALLSLTIFVF
jgi:hypothetical protein